MLELILYGLFTILTILSAFIAWKLMFAFKHFNMKKLMTTAASIDELPSVSVCIPARNETHAMTSCLESVIASRYPKLEIIVLDDSSVDNTSILIKSFAHAGVRFVQGSALPDGWLGKNHALEGLLHEASGSFIVYMDVDTRIEPDTIEQLVAYAKQESATMISVLPQRMDAWRGSVLVATLRYLWELILHRRSAPAVASSAWMIDRHALRDELGGFEPIKSAVQPEAKLAAILMRTRAYKFLIGTPLLGVSYEKKWQSQIETSIRLLFPILGGRGIYSIFAAVMLFIVNIPTLIIIAGFIDGWSLLQAMALWQLCVYIALYGLYLSTVWHKGWWLGALLWPFVIAQEFVLVIISMNRYITHRVTWKGRPVERPMRMNQ